LAVRKASIEAHSKKRYSSLEEAFPLRGLQSHLSRKQIRRRPDGNKGCHADREVDSGQVILSYAIRKRVGPFWFNPFSMYGKIFLTLYMLPPKRNIYHEKYVDRVDSYTK